MTWRLAALGLVALVAAALFPSPAEAQRQRRDSCAIPGGTASLLLIDRTSRYTTDGEDRQGERIAAGVDAIYRSLDTADRVTVATIERHRRLSLLAFDDCLPGCDPRRAGLFSNCSQPTVAQERQVFRRALFAAVIPLLNNDVEQPNSDITGTIHQTAGQHRFSRVYIYSDMLENNPVLPWSHFSARPAQESFDAVQRSGFVPSLRDTQVQIVGFGLSHSADRRALTAYQDRNIREFWDIYFAAAGARVSYRTSIAP